MKLAATCAVGAPSNQVRRVFSPDVSGRITTRAMRDCILASFGLLADPRRVVDLRGGGDFGIREKSVSLERLAINFVEAWDLVVPFEQRGCTAAAFDCALVELPNGIEHGMIVSVEYVAFELGVSSNVNLRDTFGRDGINVVHRIEDVIP